VSWVARLIPEGLRTLAGGETGTVAANGCVLNIFRTGRGGGIVNLAVSGASAGGLIIGLLGPVAARRLPPANFRQPSGFNALLGGPKLF